MMLELYRGATSLGGPLISLYLGHRRARGKEDAARFGERLGRAALPRPEGQLVWLHAASVGESLSMLPVIEALVARPGLNVLVTTGTLTSGRLMAERLPAGAFHQYVPVDRAAFVSRFLDHWRPGLALWAESEFWPNMIVETAARRIPLVLLNGRVSPRSYAGWRRFPGLIRALLGRFSLCLAQTEADAGRLRRLGAVDARTPGNLKFAAAPLPVDGAELARLTDLAAGRPLWLAASTHPGEEAIAAEVHGLLAPRFPGLLTVVAPRHPQRGPEIAAALRRAGRCVAVRSAGARPAPDTDIYLADTLGELGLFFRLCETVFIGKTLAGGGGQNPIEPARLGCALLHGPDMSNFAEIARRLALAEAAEEVAGADALAAAVARLLADDSLRRRRGDAARTFAETEAGVLARVMAALKPHLALLAAGGDARA